jgi:hypothetical protein
MPNISIHNKLGITLLFLLQEKWLDVLSISLCFIPIQHMNPRKINGQDAGVVLGIKLSKYFYP